MPQPSITKICLQITHLKFHSNFQGANELKESTCLTCHMAWVTRRLLLICVWHSSHSTIWSRRQRRLWKRYRRISCNVKTDLWVQRSCIHGLVRERCNSSALAMELRLSCTNPSTYEWPGFNLKICPTVRDRWKCKKIEVGTGHTSMWIVRQDKYKFHIHMHYLLARTDMALWGTGELA